MELKKGYVSFLAKICRGKDDSHQARFWMEVLIKNDDFPHYAWKERVFFAKGGLISEGILTLVPLPGRSANLSTEQKI